MLSGEIKGWSQLANLDTDLVCTSGRALYDSDTACYMLKSFCMDVSVSIRDKKISCPDSGDDVLLKKLWEYAGLTYLWYLVKAKDIPLTCHLVRPDNLPGGHLFSQGTHVLPLKAVAEKYNDDIEGFYQRGKFLDAEQLYYGDASIQLLPVPRIPVTLILWRGDDEFPPRADLLFDSSCEHQLPVDILWSIAMMSVLIMM